MAKTTTHSPVNSSVVAQIRDIMRLIVQYELAPSVNNATAAPPYTQQRVIINSVFSSGSYGIEEIIKRLRIIDAFYTTNASFNYFSFEEMAQAIAALGSAQAANDYFYDIACGRPDSKGLFSKPYGIQKNLQTGSKKLSLLSKYAYYCLLQNPSKYPLGFPIYDSLAQSAYTVVCRMIGLKPVSNTALTATIEAYVAGLDQLRTAIFGQGNALFLGIQQFDVLDAYLWRMGKFEFGNLSLLLDEADYKIFVNNIGLAGSPLSSFDKAVQRVLAAPGTRSPFAGTSNQTYLDALYQHWVLFHKTRITKQQSAIGTPATTTPQSTSAPAKATNSPATEDQQTKITKKL